MTELGAAAISHLKAIIKAYDDADQHIREKLQPELERLGEQRLATWWHGIDAAVDDAKAFVEEAEPRPQDDPRFSYFARRCSYTGRPAVYCRQEDTQLVWWFGYHWTMMGARVRSWWRNARRADPNVDGRVRRGCRGIQRRSARSGGG
jgi:hypothetical protein